MNWPLLKWKCHGLVGLDESYYVPTLYPLLVLPYQFLGKGYAGSFAVAFPSISHGRNWEFVRVPMMTCLFFRKDTTGSLTSTSDHCCGKVLLLNLLLMGAVLTLMHNPACRTPVYSVVEIGTQTRHLERQMCIPL